MTRLELLDLWFTRIPQHRQRATIIGLYQAAPQGIKDAMVAAMKADLLEFLNSEKTVFSGGVAEADSGIADVNTTT